MRKQRGSAPAAAAWWRPEADPAGPGRTRYIERAARARTRSRRAAFALRGGTGPADVLGPAVLPLGSKVVHVRGLQAIAAYCRPGLVFGHRCRHGSPLWPAIRVPQAQGRRCAVAHGGEWHPPVPPPPPQPTPPSDTRSAGRAWAARLRIGRGGGGLRPPRAARGPRQPEPAQTRPQK
jgi:hypothetical protein